MELLGLIHLKAYMQLSILMHLVHLGYYFLSANILVSAIRRGACDSLYFGIPHVQVSQFFSGTLQCYLICCFVDK